MVWLKFSYLQGQGVSKRCRLSWLTDSALEYEPNARGGGGGLRPGGWGSQPMSTEPEFLNF